MEAFSGIFAMFRSILVLLICILIGFGCLLVGTADLFLEKQQLITDKNQLIKEKIDLQNQITVLSQTINALNVDLAALKSANTELTEQIAAEIRLKEDILAQLNAALVKITRLESQVAHYEQVLAGKNPGEQTTAVDSEPPTESNDEILAIVPGPSIQWVLGGISGMLLEGSIIFLALYLYPNKKQLFRSKSTKFTKGGVEYIQTAIPVSQWKRYIKYLRENSSRK